MKFKWAAFTLSFIKGSLGFFKIPLATGMAGFLIVFPSELSSSCLSLTFWFYRWSATHPIDICICVVQSQQLGNCLSGRFKRFDLLISIRMDKGNWKKIFSNFLQIENDWARLSSKKSITRLWFKLHMYSYYCFPPLSDISGLFPLSRGAAFSDDWLFLVLYCQSGGFVGGTLSPEMCCNCSRAAGCIFLSESDRVRESSTWPKPVSHSYPGFFFYVWTWTEAIHMQF